MNIYSSGTKKFLEKLGHLVQKEDILQLLQKAKIGNKEQIGKWTNEFEGIVIELSSINTLSLV